MKLIKLCITLVLSLCVFLCGCSTHNSCVFESSDSAQAISPWKHPFVRLQNTTEVVEWLNRTNSNVNDGMYKSLIERAKTCGETIKVLYKNKELESDVTLVPEQSGGEAPGIYYRFNLDGAHGIIRIYYPDKEVLSTDEIDLSYYIHGKRLKESKVSVYKEKNSKYIKNQNFKKDKIKINNKNILYYLIYDQTAQSHFLNFKLESYIISVKYFDDSEFDMYDFLKKLTFQKIQL